MIQYPNGQLARKHKCRKTGKNEGKEQPGTEQRI
jgi:hypothetical protein